MEKLKLGSRLSLLLGFVLLAIIVILGGIFIPRLIFKGKNTLLNSSSSPTPNAEASVLDKNFGLEIDKLSISVPVIKNVNGNDKNVYNEALQKGLAHYLGTSLPGGKGNIFIFGHSSSDEVGPYGEIFARLDELEDGDLIKVYYKFQQFSYEVSEKRVVESTDLSVLERGNAEKLTLMTCWPIGTKDKRIIVVGYPKR